MKPTLGKLSFIAVLSGFTIATHAQVVVWSQNFDSLLLGAYGAHTTDFINSGTTPALPANNIVAPGQGGSGNAMALTFNAASGINLNLQTATLEYPASGNTSANLSDYILELDFAVQGVDLVAYQGLEINVFGAGSWIFNGNGSRIDLTSGFPSAGSGYQHLSLNLGTFIPDAAPLDPTGSSFSVGIGVVCYGNPMTASPETLLVDNIQISMIPEPSTLALLGLGLLAGRQRHRRLS